MKANLSDNKWPISLLIILSVITVFRFWMTVIYYNWFAGQEINLTCSIADSLKLFWTLKLFQNITVMTKNVTKPKNFNGRNVTVWFLKAYWLLKITSLPQSWFLMLHKFCFAHRSSQNRSLHWCSEGRGGWGEMQPQIVLHTLHGYKALLNI